MSLLLAFQTAVTPINASDVGAGSDATAALVALSLVEAGLGLDQAISVALDLAEAGVGVDVFLSVALSLVDAGVGLDEAVRIALDQVEAGVGVDGAVDIGLSGSDVGGDADSASVVDVSAVPIADDDAGVGEDEVFTLIESTPNSQTILRGIENYTLGSGRSRRRRKPSDTDMQRAGKRWLSGGGTSEGDVGGG